MKQLVILFAFVLSVKGLAAQTTYTFTGNGNWSDSTNWLNNQRPPETLPANDSIIINPSEGGQCILNTPQFILQGAVLNLPADKKLVVNENLVIKPEQFLDAGLLPSSIDSMLAMPIFDMSALGGRMAQRPMLDASFSLNMPPPMRQGAVQNNCAVFAAAYILRSFHLYSDECNIPYVEDDSRLFSPSFLYNEFMHLMGDLTCDGKLSFADHVLPKMKSMGTATLLEMPYNENSCSERPNDKQKKNAASFRIISKERIADLDFTESKIKTAVFNKYPILIGVTPDQGFKYDGTKVWASPRGTSAGGHALVICGWDDAKNAYKVMNPWGYSWGERGFGWLSYDYIYSVVVHHDMGTEKLWEAYIIKTAPTNYDPGIKILNTEPERYTGEEVLFSDTSQPKAASSRWYFEGGTPETSTEKEPKVVWNEPGTYTVQLTINQECPAITKYKDTTIIIEPPLTFTDARDGQVYTYKKIGTQYWMTQNLNYAATGSWCYNNDGFNCGTYGRLYDWNTALTVAPPGWHLPSDAEWTTLITYLGDFVVAGGKMKSTSGWLAPNVGATNSSGFTGLPGGFRADTNAGFGSIGDYGSWWSSTADDATFAWYRFLRNVNAVAGRDSLPMAAGFSVRCVRD